jgi:23S rRNA pseudouridine2605 synthase
MPRDNDKNNDSSRGRRDRPGGGSKGRSGAARGPEKKFAKRGFADKGDGGERKPYAGKPDRAKPYEKKPYAGGGKPYAGKRDDDRPPRRAHDGDAPRPRGDRPSGDRPQRFNREDRPAGDKRPYTPRGGDRDARPAARSSDRKFGDKKPYASRDGAAEKRPFKPRGEGFRKDGDRPQRDRPYGDRPQGERKFGGDKKFSRGAPDRGPRKDFGDRGPRKDFSDRPERGDSKPWQKRDAGPRDDARPARPPRDGARNFDKPRFDKPRYDKPREGGDERPRFSKPREDRPKFDRPRSDRPGSDRPKFDRPREGSDDRPKFDRPRQERNAWQEHPRNEPRSSEGFSERPRRDNEDDSKVFAKRPAFGGRGAYRERPASDERRPSARPPREKKSGERIAKVVSRAGLASRRDAEEWITHKPRGLMTTHADPEGRPTVFDNLPEGLPRLISIGRLDFNTEGLLLLTNDGGLARALELPDTGWLRRYRVRAHGEVTQAQLDELKKGVEVDGVKYGSIDATLERDQGANVWLVFAIREGKNREVRNVMAHLGLEVNRLIRISYGPFQLAELEEGKVEEVKTRVLREQLGEKIAALAGADFNRPMPGDAPSTPPAEADDAPRGKKPFKPAGKSALIADRKGRRVLVQRTGSEESRARNEAEANGYGPPRRPQRGYHGKRDLKPLDE